MADLEPQVCAILEIMVNAAVSEMNKVIGASDPPRPQETSCVAEDTHGSPEDKVIQLSVFMSSLAQEAVEKICQLFRECSSALQLEVTQGVAEIEDLKRRLEVAETELKLALEGSRGQKDVEELTEGGSGQKEGRVDVEVVQLEQRSGRKSRRNVVSGDAGVKRSPIIHLWKGRTYDDSIQPVIIKEEGFECLADRMSSDSGQYRDEFWQDEDDPDYQAEPDDPDDVDPGYTTRSKRVVKGKSHQAQAKKESQKEQALSCKHCRKTFTKLLQLKAHQAVHGASAEKPFQCSQCGRGFAFQRSLSAHMLLHTGERPHTCDVCGKGFTLKQLLRNHQRLHADVRPYRCEQCGGPHRREAFQLRHLREML
ncbi:unnamed protein product [Oreochromis niloticus]|nr:unnamed protein product [Mustela putorius furo]